MLPPQKCHECDEWILEERDGEPREIHVELKIVYFHRYCHALWSARLDHLKKLVGVK